MSESVSRSEAFENRHAGLASSVRAAQGIYNDAVTVIGELETALAAATLKIKEWETAANGKIEGLTDTLDARDKYIEKMKTIAFESQNAAIEINSKLSTSEAARIRAEEIPDGVYNDAGIIRQTLKALPAETAFERCAETVAKFILTKRFLQSRPTPTAEAKAESCPYCNTPTSSPNFPYHACTFHPPLDEA